MNILRQYLLYRELKNRHDNPTVSFEVSNPYSHIATYEIDLPGLKLKSVEKYDETFKEKRTYSLYVSENALLANAPRNLKDRAFLARGVYKLFEKRDWMQLFAGKITNWKRKNILESLSLPNVHIEHGYNTAKIDNAFGGQTINVHFFKVQKQGITANIARTYIEDMPRTYGMSVEKEAIDQITKENYTVEMPFEDEKNRLAEDMFKYINEHRYIKK